MFLQEMKDATFCIEITFPTGMIPESIPLANIERHLNTLKFYSKSSLSKEECERIIKLVDSDMYNPAKHITDKVGGLKYKCYQKEVLSGTWEEVK